jgi:hypothetical protein
MDHERCAVADLTAPKGCESRLLELGVEHLPLNERSGFSFVVFGVDDNVQSEFAHLA